jgi:signal transduction histidine kinase
MICFSGACKSPDRRKLILRERSPRKHEGDADWKWKNMGQLTAGVVHDFNNLLASISGFAELILAGREDGHPLAAEPAREFARGILEAASVGQSAVKDLQNLVRPGKDGWESLDLHQVLRQSLSIAKSTLGLTVTVAAELQPVPVKIKGSSGLLHNAFINLFLNARDAMPGGGRLTVRTFFEEGEICVSIADTGTGMGPEVMARLFRRFHSTKGEKGMGIGLDNVRSAVERHGGSIEVESAPGRGTEFRISFPIL